MKIRLLTAASILFLAAPAVAQQNPLVGAWELVSAINTNGQPNPNASGVLVIYTADGIFSQIGIPRGRPRLDKPGNQLTDAEFRARYLGLQGNYGTYTAVGNRITRDLTAAVFPLYEGSQQVMDFRIEGDSLITTSPEGEQRFRRVRKGSTATTR